MSEQICLAPERPHQHRTSLHGTQVAAGALLEIARIDSGVIRHGAMLEVAPDVLHRIEFRGESGQVLERNGGPLSLDVLVYELGAMRLQ
jgi:hypothetical protein